MWHKFTIGSRSSSLLNLDTVFLKFKIFSCFAFSSTEQINRLFSLVLNYFAFLISPHPPSTFGSLCALCFERRRKKLFSADSWSGSNGVKWNKHIHTIIKHEIPWKFAQKACTLRSLGFLWLTDGARQPPAAIFLGEANCAVFDFIFTASAVTDDFFSSWLALCGHGLCHRHISVVAPPTLPTNQLTTMSRRAKRFPRKKCFSSYQPSSVAESKNSLSSVWTFKN